MYVCQCLQRDTRYTPALLTVVHEAPTEREAIAWLERNGGGVYRNLLHNFDCGVDAATKGAQPKGEM